MSDWVEYNGHRILEPCDSEAVFCEVRYPDRDNLEYFCGFFAKGRWWMTDGCPTWSQRLGKYIPSEGGYRLDGELTRWARYPNPNVDNQQSEWCQCKFRVRIFIRNHRDEYKDYSPSYCTECGKQLAKKADGHNKE